MIVTQATLRSTGLQRKWSELKNQGSEL